MPMLEGISDTKIYSHLLERFIFWVRPLQNKQTPTKTTMYQETMYPRYGSDFIFETAQAVRA